MIRDFSKHFTFHYAFWEGSIVIKLSSCFLFKLVANVNYASVGVSASFRDLYYRHF